MSLTIRHAFDDERAAVAEFFHTLMNPNVPLGLWNDLLDQRWTTSPAPCAVIAEEKGRIVGALATVHADREIDGRAVRTSNLSGMYIEKSHRGVGLGRAMAVEALARPGVEFTAYSTNRASSAAVMSAGMTALDRHRHVWFPGKDGRAGSSGKMAIEVFRDRDEVTALLDGPLRKILGDHEGMNIHPVAFQAPGGKVCLVVFMIKVKGEDVTYYDALYISDLSLFAKYARELATALLPAGDALMSIDSRFMDGLDAEPDATRELRIPRAGLLTGLAPCKADILYSEIPLFDLKLD